MVADRSVSAVAGPEEIEARRQDIEILEQRRKLLTASATACDERIMVTVNADGVLIETTFSADVVDLSYDEVAEALPLAVRAAAHEVTRKGRAMMGPLLSRDAESSVTAGDVGLSGVEPSLAVVPAACTAPGGLRNPGNPGNPEDRDD